MSIAITRMSAENALSPGTKLWLTFQGQHSGWTKKLDWYLNFAIARWQNHIPLRQSPELKSLLADEDIDCPDSKLNSGASLLISSREVFPNEQLIILADTAEMLKQIPQVVAQLQAAVVRIFMADNVDVEKFEKSLSSLAWTNEAHESLKIEVVLTRIQPS
jgi:hypothetical protein